MTRTNPGQGEGSILISLLPTGMVQGEQTLQNDHLGHREAQQPSQGI